MLRKNQENQFCKLINKIEKDKFLKGKPMEIYVLLKTVQKKTSLWSIPKKLLL